MMVFMRGIAPQVLGLVLTSFRFMVLITTAAKMTRPVGQDSETLPVGEGIGVIERSGVDVGCRLLVLVLILVPVPVSVTGLVPVIEINRNRMRA